MIRLRSATEDWEQSLKYPLECLLDTIAVIPSVHGISDRECALVKQYLFVCETRDAWCQAFEDVVGDCRVYVQSIARAFVFMRQKYLEVAEKQKGAHIIDLTFLAHGQVQSPMLPCSVHYLNDRVQSITLYEPWGCALHASAAYGILTGNISTDKVSYTDNVLPAKPSEWNTLPKDYTQIPEVVFNRGSTDESVFKMLNYLFDVLQGSVRGLFIPYFQPEGAIELPEIPLWALTNAVGLLGWIFDKRFRIHIAACLLPNSRTSLTHEIYKYPGNTINCRQYCVVPINPSPGGVVTMKIPEFDIPENVQQAFPVLNALLGTPESEN